MTDAAKPAEGFSLDFFDYALAPDRIAQVPCAQRDRCRLLVLNRETGELSHTRFHQIEKYFSAGDLLIINDSRVMYCRLYGRKSTGGKVELLLLTEVAPARWKGLVRNVGWEEECSVAFDDTSWQATVCAGGYRGVRTIQFNHPNVLDLMETQGRVPLPPYIKRPDREKEDRIRYQTVYARQTGSAAAPTAGLHFTGSLLEKLKGRGVNVVPITLHVGYGTFQVIESQDIRDHKMHAEYFYISPTAAQRINEGRARCGKVFAVGTTVVRTLENAADARGNLVAGSGWNDCYIHGDYHFKIVDHLITNFHLPSSSLLVLASSFAGRQKLLRAYQDAIEKGYRFYSYGDAMLIL